MGLRGNLNKGHHQDSFNSSGAEAPAISLLPEGRQRQPSEAPAGRDSLEEVLLAVDAPSPGEAPVSQLHLAVHALEAAAVPVSIQDLQDELIQDVLVATSTLGNLYGEKRERDSVSLPQLDQALKWMPHRT